MNQGNRFGSPHHNATDNVSVHESHAHVGAEEKKILAEKSNDDGHDSDLKSDEDNTLIPTGVIGLKSNIIGQRVHIYSKLSKED